MIKKSIGLVAFAATGTGLLLSVGFRDASPLDMTILMIVGYFFTLSLVGHYNSLKEGE